MNENSKNVQNPEGVIDLRDLFTAIWKQKIIIISIIFITALLTGIYSKFILTPVYNANLNIVMNMPETYHTKYGDYSLPITSNQQYIELFTSNNVLANTIKDMGYDSKGITIEDLKESITIKSVVSSPDNEQNSFNILISAKNPKESQQLAVTLYDNYIEFIDIMTKESILSYYYNFFTVELKSLEVELETSKEILNKNIELLREIPQTINQKEAMNEIDDQINVNDFIVLEDIINPNYTKVENDIITNKQTISMIEESIRNNNQNLENLGNEKMVIDKYYESGDKSQLQESELNIVETSIYLPSIPTVPNRKASPNNTKNVIYGSIIGAMLGVFVALLRKYWFMKV